MNGMVFMTLTSPVPPEKPVNRNGADGSPVAEDVLLVQEVS
jgi:hypothetical protein